MARPALFVIATATSLILLACAASTTATPTPAPTATAAAMAIPPEAAGAVDAAMTDAASHLSVSREQLQLDQVTPMQWPDSSLGCPEPGQMYSQIVTPGFLILIASGDRHLEYHADTRSRVTLCREN